MVHRLLLGWQPLTLLAIQLQKRVLHWSTVYAHYLTYSPHLVSQNNRDINFRRVLVRLPLTRSRRTRMVRGGRRLQPFPDNRFVVAIKRKIRMNEVIIIYLKNINWLKYGSLDGTGRHSQHVPLLFPKPSGGHISVKLLSIHLSFSLSLQSKNSWLTAKLLLWSSIVPIYSWCH